MNRCKEPSSDYSAIENGIKDVLKAQMLLAREAVKFGGGMARWMADGLSLPALSPGGSCCEIPEPCWMPSALGEVQCQLRPGDRGEICLSVTNGDYTGHPYSVVATGKDAHLVNVKNPQFQLGPKERACVVVTLDVPKDGVPKDQPCCCEDIDVVIWVRGCRNFYLRWVVQVRDKGKCYCHEIKVIDQPDYVLHWYDHFYINRRCMAPAAGK
jgi:hypothetical protein